MGELVVWLWGGVGVAGKLSEVDVVEGAGVVALPLPREGVDEGRWTMSVTR